jgi:hypothetical protein
MQYTKYTVPVFWRNVLLPFSGQKSYWYEDIELVWGHRISIRTSNWYEDIELVWGHRIGMRTLNCYEDIELVWGHPIGMRTSNCYEDIKLVWGHPIAMRTSNWYEDIELVWGHRISYNLNFWLKFRTVFRNTSCSFNLKMINFCISKQTTVSSVRIFIILQKSYAVAQLVEALRYKSEGRRLDGVTGIFHWHNPSGCTMALGLTQPLTDMSTRDISWG